MCKYEELVGRRIGLPQLCDEFALSDCRAGKRGWDSPGRPVWVSKSDLATAGNETVRYVGQYGRCILPVGLRATKVAARDVPQEDEISRGFLKRASRSKCSRRS